jgi:hypothetical protein
LAVTLHAAGAVSDAAGRVWQAFTRFVDLIHDEGAPLCLEAAERPVGSPAGLVTATWEARFPKMAPEDFAVLERMVRCSVPGGARFQLIELAPEHTLEVRSLERDEEPTWPEVPWDLAFFPADEPAVRLTFAQALTDEVKGRVTSVLGIWGDVLGLGGFPGPEGRAGSTGRVVGVEAVSPLVLRARLEGLACGHAAWEALFEVLSRVHATAALRRADIHHQAQRRAAEYRSL